MATLRSMFQVLALASAVSVLAVPAMALAGEGRGQQGAEEEAKHGKDGKEKHFPIKAEKFQKHVEKRIEKARAKLEAHLKEKNLAEDKRALIRKEFEAGATEVRALAKKVGEDGTVTKDEAEQVRTLARSMKQKAREKLGHGKKHDKKN